jgi:hypothetical protein
MPTLRTPAEQGTRVRRLAGMRRPGYQVLEWGLDQDVIGRRTRTGIGGPIGEVRFSAFDHRCQLRATEQAGRPAAQHDEPAQLPERARLRIWGGPASWRCSRLLPLGRVSRAARALRAIDSCDPGLRLRRTFRLRRHQRQSALVAAQSRSMVGSGLSSPALPPLMLACSSDDQHMARG